jgi:hypothetical protein
MDDPLPGLYLGVVIDDDQSGLMRVRVRVPVLWVMCMVFGHCRACRLA